MLYLFGVDNLSKISAKAAVGRGHLVVTLPVCLIIACCAGAFDLLIAPPEDAAPFSLINLIRALRPAVGLLVGIAIGWFWWSFSVSRWRQWAHENGADKEETQQLAVRTGLVWPRGSIFEKTEFRTGRKSD